MNVLVDTSVWSLALRRNTATLTPESEELAELIREGRAVMMGAVRQELLSGIRDKKQFTKLRDKLRAFPDLELDEIDYEEAAFCFNRCRAVGLQGSNTDFLICAVTLRRQMALYTTDQDFAGFAKILDLKLHQSRTTGSE
jgi:predicted nucleic acid-binding protein